VATPRLVLLALIVIPALVYVPTALHEYAMRDDYSHLREAHEEPGKLLRFHASLGRPVYGALMESSFAQLADVPSLRRARLGSLALLVGLGLFVLSQLRALDWALREATAVALGLTLLPAARMMVAWAAQWGFALALWFSVSGFALGERALRRQGGRTATLAAALAMYTLAALTYQSHAGFSMLLVGAALLASRRSPRWVATHVALFLGGLLAAFMVTRGALHAGLVPASSRTVLERMPLDKLGWFFTQPLPDALALFVLHDDARPHAPGFWLAVAAAFTWLAGASVLVMRERPRREWLAPGACLLALPFITHVVSLAAAERSTAYRTQFGLSALMLVYVVAAHARLGRSLPRAWPALLGLLLAVAWFAAGRQSFALVAESQGREWARMRDAVAGASFGPSTRVYVVEPTQADRLSELIHYDEFGSLTSASDWAPREMFTQALRVRFPHGLPRGHAFSYAQGRALPGPGAHDLVIDMRMRGGRP
jgi:hypothetical protein